MVDAAGWGPKMRLLWDVSGVRGRAFEARRCSRWESARMLARTFLPSSTPLSRLLDLSSRSP